MKIALILDCRHCAFLSQAQEINAFLQASQLTYSEAELWLFYSEIRPRLLPDFMGSVTTLRWIKQPSFAPVEQQLTALMFTQQGAAADTLIFSSDECAAELATRLAYRLRGESFTGVTQMHHSTRGWQVSKAVYGQQMVLTLALTAAPCCLSVAAGGGQAVMCADFAGRQIDESPPAEPLPWLVAFEQQPLAVENQLQHARCIVVLGQGVGSAAQVQALQTLAGKLGAEMGVSRPLAMNGWCEMSRMIGMSGQNVAPPVCIAAGVSGAAALMAGIHHSEFIVAINTDPQAAIFAQADVGIVGDLQEVLTGLHNCFQSG